MSKRIQHFLSLKDLSSDDLIKIISRAIELKKDKFIEGYEPLKNKTLALVFDKLIKLFIKTDPKKIYPIGYIFFATNT